MIPVRRAKKGATPVSDESELVVLYQQTLNRIVELVSAPSASGRRLPISLSDSQFQSTRPSSINRVAVLRASALI